MQHVQRMRRISTPRTRAESDFAECSDASLPPPFFLFHYPLVAPTHDHDPDCRLPSMQCAVKLEQVAVKFHVRQ